MDIYIYGYMDIYNMWIWNASEPLATLWSVPAGLSFSEKMMLLDKNDMFLVIFDIFNEYLVRRLPTDCLDCLTFLTADGYDIPGLAMNTVRTARCLCSAFRRLFN